MNPKLYIKITPFAWREKAVFYLGSDEMHVPDRCIKRDPDKLFTKVLINQAPKLRKGFKQTDLCAYRRSLWLRIHIYPWFPMFYICCSLEGQELFLDFFGFMVHLIYS